MAKTAPAVLSSDFAALYSEMGRPSIPPEMLLRAVLWRAFYSVRSERQLMERLDQTCCSAGSSAWASMTWRGAIRPSRRASTTC